MQRSMMSWFTLGLLTLLGFISTNVRADTSKRWNAADPNVCRESTAEWVRICQEDATPLRWSVELDCTVPNTLTVRYTDGRGDTIGKDRDKNVAEVRLECFHDPNEAVCVGSGFTPSQNLGGPFVFYNLSEAGVLPGWTCNITGCFSEFDGDSIYFRTGLANCTLPLADSMRTLDDSTTTEDTAYSDKSTGVTEVYTSSTAVDALYNITDELNIDQESAHHVHPGRYLAVLVVALILVIVVAVVIGGIIFSRRKWQRDRKTALILYNKKNMIFDPNFHPAVNIDSRDFFATPRMSISSLNLLQSLRPTRQVNVYVEAGDTMEDGISLKIEHESIDNCIHSKSSTSVVQGEISNDNADVHMSHAQLFEDNGSLNSRDMSSKNDEVSSMHSESDASSERSYKVQSSDEHKTMEGSKLECPSDDRFSVITEVMFDDNLIGDANRNNSLCNNDAHFSNKYVKSNAFCAQVFPTESQVISTSNDFELDVLSTEEVYDDGKTLESSDSATYYDLKTSVKVSRPLSDTCTDDSDYEGNVCEVNTSESAYVEPNNVEICKVKIKDPDSTLTNSYIILHPPMERPLSQNYEGLDYLSGEFHPEEEDNNFQCSASTNGLSTSSPYKAAEFKVNLDMLNNGCADTDLYGYIPSETLTREILVPASSLALPSVVETGFTVHLDFDDRCKRSSVMDTDVESDWEKRHGHC